MGKVNFNGRLLIVLSLALFLVIYNPPVFGGFSFTLLFLIISFSYSIFNINTVSAIFRDKSIRNVFKSFVLFFIYCTFLTFFGYLEYNNSETLVNYGNLIIGYVSLISISVAVVVFCIKNKLTFSFLTKAYVFAGLYQAVLGVLCLVNPAVKSFFNGLIEQNSRSEKISRTVEFVSAYRNYGFASTLFDIFGMTMSVLAVLAIYQGIKGKKIYYIIAALISLAAVINSRTSFVLILVGLLVFLFSVHGKISFDWIFKRAIFFLVALSGVFLLFQWIVENQTSDQLVWLASALTEQETGSEGYFYALFNEFLFFPDSFLSILFGTSMSPMQLIDKNTDVGYVQYIWYYGIIGSILLYAIYYKLLASAVKRNKWPESKLFRAILIMIAIYLVKLTCLGYSMASVVFVPLCIYAIINQNNIMNQNKRIIQ